MIQHSVDFNKAGAHSCQVFVDKFVWLTVHGYIGIYIGHAIRLPTLGRGVFRPCPWARAVGLNLTCGTFSARVSLSPHVGLGNDPYTFEQSVRYWDMYVGRAIRRRAGF